MKKLLIATHNKGKIGELTEFLADVPVELVSLTDVGIYEDVEETGITYFENSQIKAEFYAKKSGLPAISDDGGLEIDALGGAPGVKSRRWLGYDAKDEELVEYMKKVSRELPADNRNAWFKVVVTLALPDGKTRLHTPDGAAFGGQVFQEYSEVKGTISEEPKVSILQGYPYRSFFYLPEVHKYYHESELTPEEIKIYNHRYLAIQKLKPIIKDVFDIT